MDAEVALNVLTHRSVGGARTLHVVQIPSRVVELHQMLRLNHLPHRSDMRDMRRVTVSSQVYGRVANDVRSDLHMTHMAVSIGEENDRCRATGGVGALA